MEVDANRNSIENDLVKRSFCLYARLRSIESELAKITRYKSVQINPTRRDFHWEASPPSYSLRLIYDRDDFCDALY